MYGAVSLRYINRPLVAIPERLSDDEQSYFLPHVFNVSHERAKLDYIDVHGTRHVPEWMTQDTQDPRVWAINLVRSRLTAAAARLESFGDLPGGGAWVRMAAAVRLYANLLRSCGNFFAVQIIRDRNALRFENGPRLPAARATDTGHPDLQLLNELMRDELDNAEETIALLRRHGLDIINHAEGAGDEDTFLLGPDIIEQIERKTTIMRTHWLDAEDYFASPNK
jgi:hypothetical protein